MVKTISLTEYVVSGALRFTICFSLEWTSKTYYFRTIVYRVQAYVSRKWWHFHIVYDDTRWNIRYMASSINLFSATEHCFCVHNTECSFQTANISIKNSASDRYFSFFSFSVSAEFTTSKIHFMKWTFYPCSFSDIQTPECVFYHPIFGK